MSADAQRRERIARVFREHFGGMPTLWCRAPGRVDLMGSHTDYNLGLVLTLPIDRNTWIAARPRPDRLVRLHSMNLSGESTFDLNRIESVGAPRWGNYVQGVARLLLARGLNVRGFDGVIHSTVPLSSGLSSSAALECVTATVFEALGGWKLDPVQKALLCRQAEEESVGVNCGILDQYTSCAGQEGCALLLDCRDLSSRPVQLAPGIAVVICDTKFKRELVASEYSQRRAQCEEGARRLGVRALREISPEEYDRREAELPAAVARRCRFIVEENARVPELAAALEARDRQAIRQLTAASFRGAGDLYEICVPAMQAMMAAMLGAPGVIGARQAGAGFGGCMVAFVEEAAVGAFAHAVVQAYSTATQTRPEVLPVTAAAGTGLITVERKLPE